MQQIENFIFIHKQIYFHISKINANLTNTVKCLQIHQGTIRVPCRSHRGHEARVVDCRKAEMRVSQMEIPYLNANNIFVTSRRKKFDLFRELAYFPADERGRRPGPAMLARVYFFPRIWRRQRQCCRRKLYSEGGRLIRSHFSKGRIVAFATRFLRAREHQACFSSGTNLFL